MLPFWTYGNINWEELTEKIYETPEAFDLTPIGEGSTNANYRLLFNECHYFVRIAPVSAEDLGASIEIEYEVLQAIKNLYIAPKPIYLNINRRILVTEFMHGVHEVNLQDPHTRQKVFELMHAIDTAGITLSRDFHPYLKVIHLTTLTQTFNDPIFNDEILPTLKTIDQFLSEIQEKQLSHFDLHHGNILTDNTRIWFVDWEYATSGHPFLSLASMASTERWDDNQMKTALLEYLPHASQKDYYALYLNRIVMDIHWAAWCHVQQTLSCLDMPYATWEAEYMANILNRIKSPFYIEYKDALEASKKNHISSS